MEKFQNKEKYFSIRDLVVHAYAGVLSTHQASIIGNGIERFQSFDINNRYLTPYEVTQMAERSYEFYRKHVEFFESTCEINTKREIIQMFLADRLPKDQPIEDFLCLLAN